MPGPKTKPTKLKILEGNPGKRDLPENEPNPTPAVLPCPSYIKGAGRKEWKSIVPELYVLGVLTKIDHAALEGYCLAYGQLIEVEQELAKLRKTYVAMLKVREQNPDIRIPSNGLINTTTNGNVIIEPLLSVRKQALELMHKFLVEFGMTPASRARVRTVAKKEGEDPMEDLLSGKRNN